MAHEHNLLDDIIESFKAARAVGRNDTGQMIAALAALLGGKGIAVELDAGPLVFYDGDRLVRGARVDMLVADERHSAVIDVARSFPRENWAAKLRAAEADFKVLILQCSEAMAGLHAVLGTQRGDVWRPEIAIPDETKNNPAHVSRRIRKAMDEFIQTQNPLRAADAGGLPLKDFNRFMKHRILKATMQRRLEIVRGAAAELASR